MSAPESLINALYRAGNLQGKDIQALISSFQAVPKQVDEDIDIELNILDPETRERIVSAVINPGGTGSLTETRDRNGENSYIREIPQQVNVYPLIHTENGTGSFILTDKKFGGGIQTNGSYYQSVPNQTRLNPTTDFGAVGWLYVPSGITSGKVIFKNTQYDLNISAANTLSFHVNSKSPVVATFTNDVWFHFAVTYNTSGGQEIYIDGVSIDSDSETGSITTSSSNLGIFGTPSGTTLLGSGCRLSWLSILSGNLSPSWITNHTNGVLDTNSETEITTIPFVAHGQPKPDCSVGRCQVN